MDNRRKKQFILPNGAVLRNPIVMSPMTTYSSKPDHTFCEEEIHYYEERANEVGMVIIGCATVSNNGYAFVNPLSLESDEKIEGFKPVAEAVKKGGAKVVQQLFHGGRMGLRAELGDQPMVCPSSVPALRPNAETPKELTADEIEGLIDAFYQATRRAILAGYDGVEIHGANTFLVQQFFSPHSNRREDKWGGSIEKRALFPLEVIKAAQRAKEEFANKEFIIGYRISLEELEKPGISLEDSLYLIDLLADKGIDYIHLSLKKGYAQGSIVHTDDPSPIGKAVVEKVNGRIPVMGVSNIFTEEDISGAFDLGYDLVAIGRAMVMNPHLLAMLDEGKEPKRSIPESEAKKIYITANLIDMTKQVSIWSDMIELGK